MRRTLTCSLLALSALGVLGIHSYSHACGGAYGLFAASRVSGTAAAGRSVAEMRAAGPSALRELLAEYDRTSDASLIPTIDAVAAQRDARWSRLFWYTDLAAAKSAAAAEHKPILALRMMGNLTDEYSCANSRFFRTALYANTNVSRILRDKYILVWSSERPVPVVSIDYGDGRVLKRTITGNSIHYILSPRGDVIDALPGLYDPQTFASLLETAVAPATAGGPDAAYSHRESALSTLESDWYAINNRSTSPYSPSQPRPVLATAPSAREAAVRAEGKSQVESPIVQAISPALAPHAAVATRMTFSKGRVESPMLDAFVPTPSATPSASSDIWPTLAQHHPAHLDQHSIDLIRSHNPAAYVNTVNLDRVVHNFEQSLSVDALRNNQVFRRQILTWLLESHMTMDQLNTRVYSELFLTPRSDPWLGLVPESTYSALTGDGCTIN